MTIKLAPAVRFPGFTDVWEQRKLGSIYQFQYGHFNNNPDNGGIYPIYGANGIIGGYHGFNAENSVVIGHMGAYAGHVLWVEGKHFVTYNGTIGFPKDLNFDRKFGFHMLQHINIPKITAGSGQPFVSYSDLENIKLYISDSIDEQNKLGYFFDMLENTIALHQRQLDNYKALKKVMLQKIFNQELRFKDQEGNNYPDWEKIALNELGETYTGLSGKTKENFGKGKGRFVTYMNVYSNPIADLAMTENVEIKDGENQNEVCYGDIFFTTSSETPEEVGMSSVWLSHESKVYLNSFCFGYRLSSRSEGVISPDFLGFQLRAPHIRKKIIFLAQGSTRFNISKSKLMDIVVYMPTIEEQNKITAFLLNVDSRIKHTIQSIERLNMLKKALLQQMFI